MANWKKTVKIRHLLTDKEDYDSVSKSMNEIADVLSKEILFNRFDTTRFRRIPFGDDMFGPTDYANKLLDSMYNYADDNLIWID